MSAPALVLAPVLGALLLVTGCGGGGDDALSGSAGKAQLVKATAAARTAVTDQALGEPSTSWRPALKAVADPACASDGSRGFRWRSAASMTVKDEGTDGDGIVAALIGSLPEELKGASYVGDLDDDPVLVLPTTYGSGARVVSVDITVQRATQGWTFVVNARTACLQN